MPAVTFKPFLNARPKQDGTQQVLLRITSQRTHKYLSTSIYIRKAHWNAKGTLEKANWIKPSCDLHAAYNQQLKALFEAAQKHALRLALSGEVKAEDVKQAMLTGEEGSMDFLAFFKKELDHIKASLSYGTYEYYQVQYNQLEEYAAGKPIPFKDVNVKLLKELEKFWLGKANNRNTIAKKFTAVRAIIHRAVQEGVMNPGANPFMTFTVKKGKAVKVRLTKEEMDAIATADLPEGDRISHARDIFMFQFYAQGMRIGDALQLKWSQIQDDRILYQMDKTGKLKSVKVVPKAKAILAKYGPGEPDSFVFPFLKDGDDLTEESRRRGQIESKTAHINKLLGQLAKKCEIEKHISTHTARHSFADIARKNDVDVYSISKALGHSSIKVTEAYLNSLDQESVDDAMDSFYDGL